MGGILVFGCFKQLKKAKMSATTIIRLTQVKQLIGLSRSSIYSLMRKGQFPTTIKLGSRSVGWVESEIHSWLASRIQASRPDMI